MADYGRWTTSSSAIGAHWRKKERQQKLETQRRRQRAREVLAHQANKEYFDSNVLQKPMGLTTTKKGAQREAFAAAYGTEHEGRDTHSDLVNVKAGITTTKEKAAREAFAAAYGTEWEGEDTRSNIVRAQGGFTTTEAAAARDGFEGAYGSEWEGLAPCGTRSDAASTA